MIFLVGTCYVIGGLLFLAVMFAINPILGGICAFFLAWATAAHFDL